MATTDNKIMETEQELRDYLRACWEQGIQPTKQQVLKSVFENGTVTPVVGDKDSAVKVFADVGIYVSDFGVCEVEPVEKSN